MSTATLTPREAECVAWVAAGRTDAWIAKRLGISPRTSRFHVENARRKFDAANRAELVAKVIASHAASFGIVA